ncbi:hypothetical protein CMK11_09425 [Candidatus Poribacteria bacterium]|nr:hypothetical protein [Candidatus Poribacteria bacterium]
MTTRCARLMCIAALCAGAATAAMAASPTDTGLSARIDDLFADIAGASTPGAAVIVARNGKVLHSQGYGLANIEHDVPNTPRTKFRLGSITKSFTAAATLVLHERRLLDIEDPVGKHLPDVRDADLMTIRHLLTHTSGLSESEEEPSLFAPGQRISYSNYGYSLLGRIMERVHGKSYEDCIDDLIFGPLSMVDSGYDHHTPILKRRASGYALGATGEYVNAEYTDMSGPYAAGGLYSTVADMRLWDEALYGGTLLRPETLALAFTRVKLDGGREGGYGMGWMLGEYRGLREVAHGGDITGFNGFIARFPDERFSVVVLSNVGMHPPSPLPSAGDLAHRITQIYLGESMQPEEAFVETDVPADVLAGYVGVYELIAPEVVVNVAGDTFTVVQEDGRLYSVTKMGKAALRAASPTEFRQDGMPLTLTFTVDGDGRASEILISAGGLREFGAIRRD